MFQNKNFLLGVLRLKKCTRGVFLVITAILLSSFVAIVDVVVDQVTVMQKTAKDSRGLGSCYLSHFSKKFI
ncbi:hypothetical protein [Candidatus Liberibacter asiaticus]|uniref:hypothetical protein n=1 Tax=Liberibacter asiaticus TaxID=34021 RepID=UPI000A6E78EC|nr:hypothetical protein [Candidatus Liberibacter asiaticus]